MKYIYPAVFTFDTSDENFPNGVYLVNFPIWMLVILSVIHWKKHIIWQKMF